jgi:D-alanyl-lipoteichoic acid acyltransferase DltB (MBOAT superfamily)
LNVSAIFLLSGLWHGADWTFIVWGALHACYYLLEFCCKKFAIVGQVRNANVHRIINFFSILTVFMLVTVAWIFFRLESTSNSVAVIQRFFKGDWNFFWGMSSFSTLLAFWLLGLFVVLDWIRYKSVKFLPVVTAGGYALMLSLILLFGISDAGFVYFQF